MIPRLLADLTARADECRARAAAADCPHEAFTWHRHATAAQLLARALETRTGSAARRFAESLDRSTWNKRDPNHG